MHNWGIWIACRLPKTVIYWAVIRAFANATKKYPDKCPDEITYKEALDAL